MIIKKIRNQFPILKKRTRGRGLVYFDNAATTQKPRVVLEAMDKFYRGRNAPVHRGVYALAEEATAEYERVRDQVRNFINAKYREEIIFTSGATSSINTVVAGFAEASLVQGDSILLSDMEHHAMIVPWQAVATRKKLEIKFVPLTVDGRIDIGVFKKSLAKYRPKFVGITLVSNVLGTVNPVRDMVATAHKIGAIILVDAAQSAGHLPIDVQNLDCDFLAFSGHKIYGPNGVGILYGKKELLANLPPFIYGGHMIEEVTREKTTYAPLPDKFEGGTQPVAEVIGLGSAISFIERVGFSSIRKHERELSLRMLKGLKSIPGLTLLGPENARERIPVFSFTIAGIHPHDIATLLDREGIAVRAGHHCAQILHSHLVPDASVRMSLGIYNTVEEIDRAIRALVKIQERFHA